MIHLLVGSLNLYMAASVASTLLSSGQSSRSGTVWMVLNLVFAGLNFWYGLRYGSMGWSI